MAANIKKGMKGRKNNSHKWGESLGKDIKRLCKGKGSGQKPKGK